MTASSRSHDLRKAIPGPGGWCRSIGPPDWWVQAAPFSDPGHPGEKPCRDVSLYQAVPSCPAWARDNFWQQWRLMSHQRGFQPILIPWRAVVTDFNSTPLFWAGLSQSWVFLQSALSPQSLMRTPPPKSGISILLSHLGNTMSDRGGTHTPRFPESLSYSSCSDSDQLR